MLRLNDFKGAHIEFDKAASIEQPVQACTLYRRGAMLLHIGHASSSTAAQSRNHSTSTSGAAAELLGSYDSAVADISSAIELLATNATEEFEPTSRVECLAARRMAQLGLGDSGDEAAATRYS